jgi:N-acyl-D-amino-acid deacylase
MPLEHALRRLTAQPADLFGIRDCGRLKPGIAADITIFDPPTIGSSNHGERRYDLPGGVERMVITLRAVEYTIDGIVICERGAMTGVTAGQVLRS